MISGIGQLKVPFPIVEASSHRKMREVVACSEIEAVGDDPFGTDHKMTLEVDIPVEEIDSRQ